MKKKILALLLAVVMLVGVLPLSAIEYNRDPDSDGEYFVLKAGDATITKEDTTVDVTIDILENSGVYAMKYYVIYDKELTLVSNDNVTDGPAFADFVTSDIGSKDKTPEWMVTEDMDWEWIVTKEFLYDNDKYYADFDIDTEDVLVTTVYSECVNYDDFSTDLGTICTLTFQIDPASEKDEYKVQILPVHGNFIREDYDSPNAVDGVVEIFDAIGLTGTITVSDDGNGGGDDPILPPSYTEPTIYISDAEIVVGDATAEFTLNLVNNPGIYAFFGFIGYDDAMSLAGYEFGTVFTEGEFPLGNPADIETQHDVDSSNVRVQTAYGDHGASAEGYLNTNVYAEGTSIVKDVTNDGVIATFTLNTAALEAGEYDIVFYYEKESTHNVDFDNVDFDLVHGKLTVLETPPCEHDWVAGQAVEPTCDTKGYTPYECSLCGETKQENIVDALGHDYAAVVTDPTCTEDGYTTYTCSRCGHSYVDNYVDYLDHDYVAVVTEPTCTAKGYTTYTCSRCGDSYTADETEMIDHSWTVTGTSGTCGETGKTDFKCTVCGETKTEEGAVIQHNYEETAKTEPTCTEDGEVTSTCTICGDVKVETIPTPGHDYDAVVTDPTCTDKGYTTYTCSVCGDSYVGNEVPANGHNYEGTVTDEPECESTGNEHFVCSVCGDNYDEELPATGHDYTAVVTKPTCTEGGYTTYTCNNDATHTYVADQTAALGHDYEAVVTNPTCTEGGYTTYTCKNDATHTYVDDETAALGHDYEAVVTDPTCTEKGFTTHTCSVCGDSYKDTYVDAFGHDYEDVVTDPTCTEKGFTTHTCAVCGDSYVDSFVDALGHDEVVVVTDPTCTEAGNKNTTCTRCDLNEDEAIEALGHDLVDSDVVDATCTEKGSKHEACTRCDYEADVEIEALGHKWDNGKVTKEPTVDAEGEKTYTCEVCEETKVEKLEKLPAVEEDKKEESKEESKEEDKSHQTGDGVMMFVFVALIAIVSAAGVMFYRKRLFNK